ARRLTASWILVKRAAPGGCKSLRGVPAPPLTLRYARPRPVQPPSLFCLTDTPITRAPSDFTDFSPPPWPPIQALVYDASGLSRLLRTSMKVTERPSRPSPVLAVICPTA